jgi:hypothetical protein
MAPCSATDPTQKFDVEKPSGSPTLIKDRGSGRCVATRDCDFTIPAYGSAYGDIILDRCDVVSSCSHWTGVADPAAPGKSAFQTEGSVAYSLNVVGTPPGIRSNPVTDEEWAAVRKLLPLAQWLIAYPCGGATCCGSGGVCPNNQWLFVKSTGQLRLTAAVDLAALTVCKDHATDCCLVATPCSFPDCRLISDGWLTVLMITFAVGGYLGLGALCACNAILPCICTKPASASVSFWTTLHSTVYRSS